MADTLRDRVKSALGAAYEIEREIGRGGMGVVYRCRDQKLRRTVAIKVLPPDLAFREEVRARFLREAETAAQLNHPNIVPIFSVDDREGLVWFVMALVDGESLAARLAREPRPPFEDVQRILRDVADALAYAHARGIIHRDIKPDNILLDRVTGRPTVTDFGIARAIEGDSRLTVTGIAVGTPAYMSPEQAMGEREIDGRSDQYSLAVVGYQMLAGELPFHATNTPAMLMKHISDPLRPLRQVRPDTPPGLAAVIERALSKKPDDRWPDASAFRAALANLGREVAEAPAPARPSGPWKRPAAQPPARPALPVPERPPVRLPRLTSRHRNHATPADGNHLPRSSRRSRREPGLSRREGTAYDRTTPIPSWMPADWRAAREEWRRSGHGRRHRPRDEIADSAESRDRSILSFRRRTASTAVTLGMLAGINMMFTPGFPWVIFPAIGMSLGLMHRAAGLWADGVRFRDVFGRAASDRLSQPARRPADTRSRAPAPAELAEKLASHEVVAGPYGETVRRAATDRAAVHDALGKLDAPDRAMIPDVAPTADALAERVGALAAALHRLDEDVSGDAVARLEQRIAETNAQPESPQRGKKLALLERQRQTLDDLERRRETLQAQLESASLMLQNMHLDLLALRNAGVQSVLNDVSNATQEARALSRDIQIALEAAKDVRS